jgi:ABC-type Fe3+-citrate transport system substrate-binding protein
MYVFQGIDLQKTLADALNKSKEGTAIVHFHGKPRKCEDYKHQMFQGGERVDQWGEVDGSSYPARDQGQ